MHLRCSPLLPCPFFYTTCVVCFLLVMLSSVYAVVFRSVSVPQLRPTLSVVFSPYSVLPQPNIPFFSGPIAYAEEKLAVPMLTTRCRARGPITFALQQLENWINAHKEEPIKTASSPTWVGPESSPLERSCYLPTTAKHASIVCCVIGARWRLLLVFSPSSSPSVLLMTATPQFCKWILRRAIRGW